MGAWHTARVAWQDIPKPKRFKYLGYDQRGFAVISTVARTSDEIAFGTVSGSRKLTTAAFDWCAVCGYPFQGEARWQAVPIDEGSSSKGQIAYYGEGPVHEICLLYSAQVCPFLASPGARLGDDTRGGQRRNPVVEVLGYSKTYNIEVRPSPLQKRIAMVRFMHSSPIDKLTYERPEELRDRYERLLESETIPSVSAPQEELIAMFNHLSEIGMSVVGAAVVAGMAYAPGAFRLPGMDAFDNEAYREAAAAALDAKRFDEIAEIAIPAVNAVGRWLRDEPDEMSELLKSWRAHGKRTVGGALRDDEQPARETPRNAPCPCGSGRRARRCHPAGVPAAT